MRFAEFEEIKGVLVFDREFGLRTKLGRLRLVEVRLAEQRLFVALVRCVLMISWLCVSVLLVSCRPLLHVEVFRNSQKDTL